MKDKIDSREPKEILKTELYLNAPMIRRILNCTYMKALTIINEGLRIEKEKNLFIVNQKQKEIRTKTFKEMTNL